MKVIDLLNKIANNEEVPKKIKYNKKIYEYSQKDNRYHNVQGGLDLSSIFGDYNFNYLNDEIEIIEEKPKKIETFNLMYPISKEYKGEIGALVSIYNSILGKIDANVQDLIKAVNYLLEKESDK
jgi:hypothetical protein